MKKRICSLLLAACLLLSILPKTVFTASAEEEGLYTYFVLNGAATITSCAKDVSGDVIIPSTLDGYPVMSIGRAAFSDCTGLTSVTIGNSVTSIGSWAFYYCRSLAEIVFRGNVPAIHNYAFNDVTATAYYPAGNTTWTADKLQNYGGTLTWMAYTAGERTASVSRTIHSDNGSADGNSASFTKLVPGAAYLFLVVIDKNADDLLAADNLLYVRQCTAQADGTLSLTYPLREAVSSPVVLLCGPSLCDGGADCPGSRFTDMPGVTNWAHAGIDFALEAELFGGTSATEFSPNGNMTRGMLVTVLWRLDGKPTPKGENTFNDVKAGKYYTDAVTWAAESGVVGGVGNGKFNPDGNVTREQIAAIMFRYADFKGYSTDNTADLSGFPDNGKVSSWAKTALAWANAEALIGGTVQNGATVLDPQGNATRAQVAIILMRYVNNIVNK